MTIAIVAAHGDEIAIGVAHMLRLRRCDRALVGGFQERLVDHLRGAANVEGTHGQLRARLTDRLRGDDADSLTDVDRRAARKVAAVAGSADAGLDFAGQRRTDAYRLDACGLDLDHLGFIDHRTGLDDHFAGAG
jgi:hypothetical protein